MMVRNVSLGVGACSRAHRRSRRLASLLVLPALFLLPVGTAARAQYSMSDQNAAMAHRC